MWPAYMTGQVLSQLYFVFILYEFILFSLCLYYLVISRKVILLVTCYS